MDHSTAQLSRTIKLFVVEDHELVRRGLADVFADTADIVIVGEAATAADARRQLRDLTCDVALLDVRLPDGNGIEVCREIRAQQVGVRVLVLTTYDDNEALLAAVMAGASGYLLKEIAGTELAEAVRAAARGHSLLDPNVTANVVAALREPAMADRRLDDLTPRELEVLELITEGLTNRQIGERLFLAEKTVKNCVSRIFDKLGLQRRTQAAVYGSELRIRQQADPLSRFY